MHMLCGNRKHWVLVTLSMDAGLVVEYEIGSFPGLSFLVLYRCSKQLREWAFTKAASGGHGIRCRTSCRFREQRCRLRCRETGSCAAFGFAADRCLFLRRNKPGTRPQARIGWGVGGAKLSKTTRRHGRVCRLLFVWIWSDSTLTLLARSREINHLAAEICQFAMNRLLRGNCLKGDGWIQY